MGRLSKPDPLKVVVYLFNAGRYRSFTPREYGWPNNLRAILYLWVDDPAPFAGPVFLYTVVNVPMLHFGAPVA